MMVRGDEAGPRARSTARGRIDRVADEPEDVGQRSPEDPEDERRERARQRQDQPVFDEPLGGAATSAPNHLGPGRGDRFGGHLHHEAHFVALRR